MKIPVDISTYETKLSTMWLDESGILCSVFKKGTIISMKNLVDSFEYTKKLAKGKKLFLLADLTDISVPNKEVRDFAAVETPKFVSAYAIITNSPLSNLLANMYLMLTKPPYPTKMFTNEKEAKAWLKQYLQLSKLTNEN